MVGLVTVTYNSEEVLPGFLDSINKLNYDQFRLYIVDNNSTDNSLKLIEELSDLTKTVVISNDSNNGVAGGNNQGIKQSLEDGCEYIVLINNDTEFEPDLLNKLVEASIHANGAIVAPKIMYHSEPEVIWFGGGGLQASRGYLNYHVGTGETDQGQYQSNTVIDYAPTCCTLIPREVFYDVGLMDEKYFVYFDDTDFFYRIMRDGRHKMIFLNEVDFYHKVGSITKSKKGSRKNFKFGDVSIKYITRNYVYYLRKQKSLWAYSMIVVFYFRTILRFFISGKYHLNFKTFMLLQRSFFDGLRL